MLRRRERVQRSRRRAAAVLRSELLGPRAAPGASSCAQLPPPPRLGPRARPFLPTSGPAERPGTTAAPQRPAPAVGGGRAAAT